MKSLKLKTILALALLISSQCFAEKASWPWRLWDAEAEAFIVTNTMRRPPWTNNPPVMWTTNNSKVSLVGATNNTNASLVWTNYPPPMTGTISRSDVLVKLLEVDREEIRFWQDKFFTVSFWIDAAILAIVAFAVEKFGRHGRRNAWVRFFAFVICLGLAWFYSAFADVAHGAMITNQHDLEGIQIATGLMRPNWYLPGQGIYDLPDGAISAGTIGHIFIGKLLVMNWMLTLASFLLLRPWGVIWFVMPEPTRAWVEQRAYELYLAHGRQPGHEQQDWRAAEDEAAGEL